MFISGNEIFEPYSLENNGHSSLAWHFIWDIDNYKEKGFMLSPFDLNEKVLIKKANEIEKVKIFENKIPVISSERLLGPPYAGGYDSKTIANRIKNIFPDAKILIVIREQKSMILSTYLQYLTEGGFHSIKRFLQTNYDGRLPSFSPNSFKYTYAIGFYKSMFGKDNVLVLPYELFKQEPEEFLIKLGDFLGKDILGKYHPNKKHNISDGKEILVKTRILNILSNNSSLNSYSPLMKKPFRIVITRIRTTINQVMKKKKKERIISKLESRIEEIIGNHYTMNNKELEHMIDFDLTKYGYS